MTKIFLYGEVNLPPIPQELLVFHEPLIPFRPLRDIGYGLTHIKGDRVIKACGYKIDITKDPELLKWLGNNCAIIIGSPQEVKMQSQLGYNEPSTHVVHSDNLRTFALNYIVDIGGDDVITSWYWEKNMPLRRGKLSGTYGAPQPQQADTGKVEYTNLEILDSVKFEKNKWYLMAVDILHEVDNITGTRSSITFGSSDTTMLEVLKKENLLITTVTAEF